MKLISKLNFRVAQYGYCVLEFTFKHGMDCNELITQSHQSLNMFKAALLNTVSNYFLS